MNTSSIFFIDFSLIKRLLSSKRKHEMTRLWLLFDYLLFIQNGKNNKKLSNDIKNITNVSLLSEQITSSKMTNLFWSTFVYETEKLSWSLCQTKETFSELVAVITHILHPTDIFDFLLRFPNTNLFLKSVLVRF